MFVSASVSIFHFSDVFIVFLDTVFLNNVLFRFPFILLSTSLIKSALLLMDSGDVEYHMPLLWRRRISHATVMSTSQDTTYIILDIY